MEKGTGHERMGRDGTGQDRKGQETTVRDGTGQDREGQKGGKTRLKTGLFYSSGFASLPPLFFHFPRKTTSQAEFFELRVTRW